ncbi:hypothetical protein [Novosphingobium sp. AP12]|uniref:hypothetical protein n=1 Tax=Novosphingobium sp. AP12 TaxID=1144305 RepID=UPI0012F7AEBE|nr:hypothetical protein [Novosphingobium sp. AP12]
MARTTSWPEIVMAPIPSISTADGRRAWAFVAIWLGCIVFTLMAAWAMHLVRANLRYVLFLGLAAHLQLLVGMGALGFVLGRRMAIRGSRSGFEVDDREIAAAAAGAQLAAEATQKVAEDLKP